MNDLPWVDRALKKNYIPSEASGKVMGISEAVEKYVKPCQAILFGEKPAFPSGYPMALLNEIIRQYYNKNPRFTYIAYGGYANTLAPMIAGKMIRKVISTFMGDPYPYPSPNPIFQKAFAEKSIEMENWSMLTLTLRLMAGAAGLPFFPTRSLLGSSMGMNNPHFLEVVDPFENERVGLVRALKPDICLIHGWVADKQGNTVLNCPWGGNLYGALGAKEGVIVSVEKIVSPAEMENYKAHVRIPGAVVKAVVEVPFGSHPSGHNSFPQAEKELGYSEDEAFIMETRLACRNDETFEKWIAEWILDCKDHEQYLKKLGSAKLFELKGKIHTPGWKTGLMNTAYPSDLSPTAEEKMIVIAARYLERKVEEDGIDFILTGVGASHIASWLAYYKLMDKGSGVKLMTESGLYGYVPLPGDPFLFANRNIPTGDMYTDIFHILGCMVQGGAGRCLGVLGAGQIDRHGNINSTQIPETASYLVGSGGGNDVASGADDVFVVARQDNKRFMENVSYVTSPGEKITTLVSQYGVFQKDASGSFRLKAYLAQPGMSEKEIMDLIQSNCGWELQLFSELEMIFPPEAAEVQKLRLFDPQRYFLGKVKKNSPG